ncbi:hypothetical protein DPMN_067232 [Dreissena polymorpha]|uniref:Lysozyme n=1 Tax=Dreissena polymorpha TaxID=45954 RepID=A0A9D3YYV8_DREPO|nr:hypothetical protein DPMN_067232 [Dreissena polymorpha]
MMTMARIFDLCFLFILGVTVSANNAYSPGQPTTCGSLCTFTDCLDILRQGFTANGVYNHQAIDSLATTSSLLRSNDGWRGMDCDSTETRRLRKLHQAVDRLCLWIRVPQR